MDCEERCSDDVNCIASLWSETMCSLQYQKIGIRATRKPGEASYAIFSTKRCTPASLGTPVKGPPTDLFYFLEEGRTCKRRVDLSWLEVSLKSYCDAA